MSKNKRLPKRSQQLFTVVLALIILWTCTAPAVVSAKRSSPVKGIAIAAGYFHSLALKADGSVVAWGTNNKGQLNVPAVAQSGVVSIAAGYYHSLALRSDGSVVAWGDHTYGQTTVPAEAESGVVAIAAGAYHSLALKADGSVMAWGLQTNGQSTVPASATSGVVSIAAGYFHSLALKADGSVVGWGSNVRGQTTIPAGAASGVVSIAAGDTHSLALKADGSVIAWGSNSQGQRIVPAEAQSGVVSIAAGNSHALALKADGSIVSWGYFGQTTVPAGLSSPVKTIAVAGGFGHTLALKSDGSVVAWGLNDKGQRTVPSDTKSGVVAITAGTNHSMALKADGTVVAWGTSSYGLTTLPTEAQSDVVAIAAGDLHSMALKADGTVVAWGYGGTTVLAEAHSGVISIATGFTYSMALKADGSVVAWISGSFVPTTVPASFQSDVVAIAAGYSHALALKADGSVVAWGNNAYGQTTVPTNAKSGVVAIAAGNHHSMALKADGSVIAWGYNANGQRTVPAEAEFGVAAIVAGEHHSMALKSDGSVIAWGFNSYGQINVPGSANLSNLVMDAGELSPSFAPSVTAYTYQLVGSSAASIDVTAILSNAVNSTLLVNDKEQTSGTPVAVPLTGDITAISVRVEPYLLPGKTYTISVSQRYTVTYDGNGSNGGSVPADNNAYSPNNSVTVLSNTGSLSRTGYTFAGWNTAADGSGTSYAGGSTYTMSTANVTLYAQWLDNTAPAITIQMKEADESLYANDTWTNQSVTVSVYATDNGSGLATLEYSEDGGASWLPVVGEVTYSEEGIHTLTFKATDEDGNEGQETRTVKINRNGLVITISANNQSGNSYASGDWTNGTVTAEVYATHQDGIAVTTLEFSLDDGAIWFNYTEPLSISGAGTQMIKVKARDEAGNALEDALTVKIDQTDPSIEFGTNGNETWSLSGSTLVTVSDTESGLNLAALAFAWSQSDTVPADGWAPFTSGADLTKRGVDGDWYLHIRAQDTVGNMVGTVSQRFRLDTSAAELNGLVLSAGTLDKVFDPSTMDYKASVADNVSSITLTPVTLDATDIITVRVEGGTPSTVTSGLASEPLVLNTGVNTIEIDITALNGERKTYSVTVTRAASNAGTSGGSSGESSEPVGKASLRVDSTVIEAVAIKTVTRADGAIVEQVSLDEETLDEALNHLKDAKQPVLTIEVDDSERVVLVELPAASIAAGAESFPNAIIEVKLNRASYQLVIHVLNLAGLAEQLGVELKDLLVNIILERADEVTETQIRQLAVMEGFNLASEVIDFKVMVEANGQTEEIRDFGGTYMTRAIVTEEGAANRNLTGVLYDRETNALTFVPSHSGTRPDGTQEVIMNVPHNSMYVVLESKGRTFDDLSGHWAKADVELLASKLIVRGITDSQFAPDADITRAEFTALLVRALGLSQNLGGQTSGFADVTENAWYMPAVEAAVNAGLVSGMSLGRFAPNERITREQMAVMLAKALSFAGKGGAMDRGAPVKFTDRASISTWAIDTVAQAVAAGIITGMPDGTYMPSEHATRAQATTMLKRFLQYTEFID
ncbi:RCC1 domain-containing protein [Paenibacillus oceani]|uniref:S-layer homology domain-containing protein n=1 Tax=Paenibacillus oceani TaxID=2772510 RepID=A0A927GYT0_9BACL|nr:S-layer homology domain-containing protein [Paenibacillus oceani]MBD2862231.1 S-layer homology domain-containing protein [Paenibacillus oceani]